MHLNIPKEWLFPESWQEMTKIQRLLSERVICEDRFSDLKCLGGMDVSNNRFDPLKRIYSALVMLDSNWNKVTDNSLAMTQTLPYLPGFLGFREVPSLVQLIQSAELLPDLIFVDGHGIAHPRGLGIASHLGVLIDVPTIGVAKNILVGEPESDLGSEIGDFVALNWKNQTIGALVRTKKRCKPLIVSPGHRISLKSAVDIVLKALKGYRLPEPTRFAHLAANECRRQEKKINERGEDFHTGAC
ncbi:MAG: endonuclease V [Parachlamydiales bacterium]|nr:endonuclease V [Parachlamydiales bacterium]